MGSPLKRALFNQTFKNGSGNPFLLSLIIYLQEKSSQISVQVACGDHIVLISKLTTFVLANTLKIIGKCKKNLYKLSYFQVFFRKMQFFAQKSL